MFGINLSPLQYLAANGIAFAAGIATTIAFQWYGKHMHAAAMKQAKASSH
ncbi:hypothetical protein [Pseudomonas sp. B1-22]